MGKNKKPKIGIHCQLCGVFLTLKQLSNHRCRKRIPPLNKDFGGRPERDRKPQRTVADRFEEAERITKSAGDDL